MIPIISQPQWPALSPPLSLLMLLRWLRTDLWTPKEAYMENKCGLGHAQTYVPPPKRAKVN